MFYAMDIILLSLQEVLTTILKRSLKSYLHFCQPLFVFNDRQPFLCRPVPQQHHKYSKHNCYTNRTNICMYVHILSIHQCLQQTFKQLIYGLMPSAETTDLNPRPAAVSGPHTQPQHLQWVYLDTGRSSISETWDIVLIIIKYLIEPT